MVVVSSGYLRIIGAAKMKKWIDEYIEQHKKIISGLNQEMIVKLIEVFKKTRDEGRQIFIIGNGGDAAIASHLGVDLGKGGSLGRTKRFRVFVPSDNIPWLTAIANDLSYEDIFVEQIENFAQKDDFLFALSVSGSSPNIVKAIKRAKELGMKTGAITGDRQGKIIKMVDIPVVVPSAHFGLVEDIQSAICHMIGFYFIEKEQQDDNL